MACVDPSELIDAGLNRILTQYRESPNLLFLLKNYLGQAAEAHLAICEMLDYFDLDTAVGHQLTLIGKRMGFPRTHCICDVEPVFGFSCGNDDYPIVGFCSDGTWLDCSGTGIAEITIDDDDLYRSMLKARRYQMQRRYGINDLTAALHEIFGPTAMVLDAGQGRVVVAPFRELTQLELSAMDIIGRVLPVAPGIRKYVHLGTSLVAGFGDGWGGFCDEYEDGTLIDLGGGYVLGIEVSDFVALDTYIRDADWMCEKPLDCFALGLTPSQPTFSFAS